ncbi:hypothetical protein [Falsiphaeobacter marinintestinus]|uniref:hypothetical protein n=1 Tax=Falsiphaeobacter marinintestinus TaxID=1492905 RepID=UPI0016470338|nr:hypothetical protein [Phaeobacter marinintestinus]
MKEWITKQISILWSHKTIYAGLAGAYGASCLGLDKELVNQIVTALYVAMVLKAGH